MPSWHPHRDFRAYLRDYLALLDAELSDLVDGTSSDEEITRLAGLIVSSPWRLCLPTRDVDWMRVLAPKAHPAAAGCTFLGRAVSQVMEHGRHDFAEAVDPSLRDDPDNGLIDVVSRSDSEEDRLDALAEASRIYAKALAHVEDHELSRP